MFSLSKVWSVDSEDPATRLPRLHLPFFPDSLTDTPSLEYALRLLRRLQAKASLF